MTSEEIDYFLCDEVIDLWLNFNLRSENYTAYCFDDSASMKLMIENKISLVIDEASGIWTSGTLVDADFEMNNQHHNENPRRAIGVTYLKIIGAL